MNKAKRILVLLIVLCLCGTVHAADLTKEEAYAENLGLLDLYLQADPAAGVDINVLCSNFQALGNYRCSMEFWLYASVLSALERDEYNEALRFYNVLTLYAEEGSSFTNLFADNSFTDAFPAIRPIAEMEQYIQARKEENAGNQTKAAEHYEKCLKFFDARSRYQLGRPDLDLIYAQILVQLKDGDYAAAMENARLLMSYGYEGAEDLYFVAEMQLAGAAATPAPQETVAPAASFALTGSADKGKVTLRWEKVPGASKYRIYHAVIKHGEKNFALVTETSKTVIALTQTEAGVNNYYYIEAIGNNGSDTFLARSEETSIYVSRTSGTHLTIGNGNGSLSDEAKDWLSSTPTSYGYEGAEDLYFVAEMQLAGAAATPAPQETVAPAASFALTGSADKGKVTLRWEKVPGASKYRIYHAVIKHGEKNFALVTETSKTVIALTQTEAGVNNYYYIEAIGNNGSDTFLARSEETSIYVSRTSGTHLTIGNGNGSLSDEAKDWLSSTPTPKPGGGLTIGNGSDDGWTIGNGNGSLSDEAKDWLASTPTPKPGGGLTIGNGSDDGWTIGNGNGSLSDEAKDWLASTPTPKTNNGITIFDDSDIDWGFETENSNEDDDLSSKWSMTGTPASDSNTGITILDDTDEDLSSKWSMTGTPASDSNTGITIFDDSDDKWGF